jgi:hypothetical protein
MQRVVMWNPLDVGPTAKGLIWPLAVGAYSC